MPPPFEIAESVVGMLMPPPLVGGAISWDCQAEYRGRQGRGGNVVRSCYWCRGRACWREGAATRKNRRHTTRRGEELAETRAKRGESDGEAEKGASTWTLKRAVRAGE